MYALIGSATLIFLCLIIIIAQLNNKRKIRRVIASLEEKLNNKNTVLVYIFLFFCQAYKQKNRKITNDFTVFFYNLLLWKSH